LVNASNGSVLAQYEYGPFGEGIRANGPMSKLNPFRFSTKYQDDESDLLYYGHRYYNGSTGRWSVRDPARERAGRLNLYQNANNDLLDKYDFLGLWPGKVQCTPLPVPPGLLTSGPWTMVLVEPSSDYAPVDGSGTSLGVRIIYKHQVTQTWICNCKCPKAPTFQTPALDYYIEKDADAQFTLTWNEGPGKTFIPDDLIGAIIDLINDSIYAPSPSGKLDKSQIDGLVQANMPSPSDLGQPKTNAIPTRWCINK
jgi:RHS repeat-associated protein